MPEHSAHALYEELRAARKPEEICQACDNICGEPISGTYDELNKLWIALRDKLLAYGLTNDETGQRALEHVTGERSHAYKPQKRAC